MKKPVITQTVDGKYIVLIEGLQKGGEVDNCGAGNAEFETFKRAEDFAETLK